MDSDAFGMPAAAVLSGKEAKKDEQTYLPPPSQPDEAGASGVTNP